ncbi:hypothetical protein [Flavobacterium sp. NRK F7]|uniref:hypothetical protein n=1 Tax=Flavobacterium sp. NRK F7 TaxID=2954930 RepID=UPI00209105A9|nr:hypothetical protein [Flavobacterium sp. NRK F7]MCO6161732.1 hypothetical protein [Flavobacterium sp. NRK F7]
MKKVFSIILFFVLTFSFSQFKLPQKKDWEIALNKPIVILQLDESNEYASVYNTNIKKYAEEYFGANRIEKYLPYKEFKKFIKGNKEEYNFIGFQYDIVNHHGFFQIYFGITGKAFMINGGYLSTVIYEDKSTLFKKVTLKLTEADIKFAVGTFKNEIVNGFQTGDKSLRDLMKESKKSLKEINPTANALKGMTLLLDKDLLGENFINEFSKNYKYKFEAVDKSRIDSAILNNEKDVAFLFEYCRPSSDSKFYTMLYIYKAEDNSLLFSYVPDRSSGIGFVDLIKGLTTNYSKEYVQMLNSVID